MPEIEIDARVSGSLHPDNLAPVGAVLDRDGTPGQEGLRAAKNALQTMYEARTKVEHAKQQILHDGSRTEDGQILAIADLSDQTFDRVSKVTSPSENVIGRSLEALEHRMREATRAPGSSPMAAEIRAHAKQAGETETMTLVRRAAERGDLDTVGAVLNAPAYLSGITEDTQGALRTAAAKQLAPDDWAQYQALQQARTTLERAIQAFQKASREDADQTRVASIRFRANAANRALGQTG